MEKPKDPISEWGFRIEKEVRGKPGESFLELLDRFYGGSEDDETDETDEGDGKA